MHVPEEKMNIYVDWNATHTLHTIPMCLLHHQTVKVFAQIQLQYHVATLKQS